MDRILIIEDDRSIAELERDYLEVNGFECDIAENGRHGMQMLESGGGYALVVLDIMLPDIDGFEVCSKIRRTHKLPVLFLSAKNTDIDKIRGLGIGADDYMTKPFSPSEFVARVRAHIARYDMLTGSVRSEIRVRSLVIEKDSRRVFLDGAEVTMPTKEYELLLFLAENPNRVFSKDILFDRVWGLDALGDISTVTVHIQRIREKLEKKEKFIETVWGVGYRFKV